jgi:amino acid adenylation domain-containing protein
LVAEAFTQVLGLPGVGIHDDFFHLGGHSLKAMQLVSRLRTLAGAELAVRVVFDAPTVAGLARAIEVARAGGVRVLPALRARAEAEECALSYAQQRLWFLDQWEGPGGTYNIPAAWRLRGALNVAALERALDAMVARHEVLRTVYRSVEGEPSARVLPVGAGLLSVVDLREVPEREAAMMALVAAEAGRAFDLASGPVLRASLVVMGEAEHVLVVCVHHIAFDGWSQGVFWRELSVCYGAYCEGREAGLPELAVQYADYACWQRGWLEGEVLAAQALVWKEALMGFPQVLELPTDRARPVRQTHRGGVETVVLPVAVLDGVQALARREGVTVYMVLLGAFQALLHRYTGQAQLLVGTPVAGRQHEDLAGLIGFFVNTLVMKADFTDGPSFQTHLGRVRAAALEAYAHQDVPFEKLVEVLGVARDPSRSPLFQVMFSMVENGGAVPSLGGLAMERVEAERRSAKFDLGLFMAPGEGGLVAALEYNADLFEAETAARMLGHLGVLLADAVARPETLVGRLALLTEAEQQQMVEWNRTEAEVPETTLHALFEAQVERTPDAVAVVFEGESLTYRALDERANQLAHHLRSLGVGPDVVVGICVERSLDMVVGLMGILKAGGAYVPFEPSHPVERLADALEDAEVAVLLARPDLVDVLPPTRARVVGWEPGRADWNHRPADKPAHLGAAGDRAYVLFTSGSTGKPKGVSIEHRNIVHYVTGVMARLELEPRATYALVSTLAADLGNTVLFPSLCGGGCIHVIGEDLAMESLGLAAYFGEHRIDCLKIVPSHLEALLAGQADARLVPHKRLILGGEASSWGLIDTIRNLRPGCVVMNHYGPTETTVGVLTYRVDPAVREAAIVPLGRPLPNVQVHVLDGERNPVPVGVAGEVYIGGAGVARGYLNRPALTEERFVPDPWRTAPARLYRTGDRAIRLTTGALVFVGRVDHQVKLRGFRIELGEIETVLGQCAGVQQCIVVVREDRPGEKVLVAYVVGEAGAGELREALGQRLPEYMVPSAFVRLEALPLTPNGKVDRKGLPAPTMDSRAMHVGGAPRSPLEALVAEAFTQVLGLPGVGIHDDFFQLGGHSLKAMQLVSRLRTLASAELAVRVVFDAPTVAGLARAIEVARAGGVRMLPALRARPGAEDCALSYAQQRLWFLDQWEGPGGTYNIPAAWRLRGALDVGALERALATMVTRHGVLRTVYRSVEGEPVARVLPVGAGLLSVVDLRAVPEPEAAMMALVEAEAGRAFDLGSGPVLRASLAVLGEAEHVLVVCVHHIAFDGWSQGVFWRELSVCYGAYCEGREAGLPGLAVQYADYACWQRGWLEGEVLAAQALAWKEALAGYPQVLELPTDRPRPVRQTHRGGVETVVLPVAVQEALQALARREGVTVFMVLLGAFQALLHRYTGQAQLLVGTPVAGRQHEALEGLIGFFVNTLVMKADFSDEPSFREHLGRVRTAALEAYAHQDVPFEKLVEVLGVARDPSRSPLFQVMFSMVEEGNDPPTLGGLAMVRVEAERRSAKFDLGLFMAPTGQGLVASLEYNADLFEAGTAARMLGHLGVLVADAVARPETPVGRLALLTEAERYRIVVEWNRTEIAYPETTLQGLFEAQVERTPDAVAVVFEGESLTYRALDEWANQLAHYLQSLGVGPEVLVGLCVERSLEMVVGLLGILKAGGAYVPLDPAYPRERLAFMLEDACVPVLVTQQRLLAQLPPTVESVRLSRQRGCDDLEPVCRQAECPRRSERSRVSHLHVRFDGSAQGRCAGAPRCCQSSDMGARDLRSFSVRGGARSDLDLLRSLGVRALRAAVQGRDGDRGKRCARHARSAIARAGDAGEHSPVGHDGTARCGRAARVGEHREPGRGTAEAGVGGGPVSDGGSTARL